MKKSDADALALRILFIQIQNNKVVPLNSHILQDMAQWSELLQQFGDDDINLDLITHPYKSS